MRFPNTPKCGYGAARRGWRAKKHVAKPVHKIQYAHFQETAPEWSSDNQAMPGVRLPLAAGIGMAAMLWSGSLEARAQGSARRRAG
jgi:hypothetical protein